MGLYPVVGSELEFYLIDSAGYPEPPISPYTGKRLDSDAILSIDELDDFGNFFSDVQCRMRAPERARRRRDR